MNNPPFFSILIPTKNRANLVGNAIQSVLNQTFKDFELIICDNDDTEATRHVADKYNDDRIHYIRTSGNLSMPDNWEYALSFAKGKYITVLTDRSVYRPDSLEIIYSEIHKTKLYLVAWDMSCYGGDENGLEFIRAKHSKERTRYKSKEVINQFLSIEANKYIRLIPRMLNSCCHIDIINKIIKSVGRLFLPMAPDITSAFLQLAFVDEMLFIKDGLFVSCYPMLGNGYAYDIQSPLDKQFFNDIGKNAIPLSDKLPVKVRLIHVFIMNNFLFIKDKLPDRFIEFEIQREAFYISCLKDIARVTLRGINQCNEIEEIMSCLQKEPYDLRLKVLSHPINLLLLPLQIKWFDGKLWLILPLIKQFIRPLYNKMKRTPKFKSVFEAIDWEMSNS
jgi:glycosyltransferase involved in cell wall biosynthesis